MITLFCHVGWMTHYQGQTANDTIRGGGSYVDDKNIGHEVCNFTSLGDVLYGYVQVGRGRNGKYQEGEINFKRLGAPTDDEVIEGGTVFWTATEPEKGGRKIVGWYKNASIFRKYQKFTKRSPRHKKNGISRYLISARAADCVLLAEDKRNFLVPRMKKGFPGISPIWYADSEEGAEIVAKALSFVSTYKDSDFALNDLEPDAIGNMDPARVESTQYRFKRDASVRNAVLFRANGLCEYCHEQGFLLPHGGHYLEAHHIISLAADGPDTLENVIALCPKHHREAHFGAERIGLEESFSDKLKMILKFENR